MDLVTVGVITGIAFLATLLFTLPLLGLRARVTPERESWGLTGLVIAVIVASMVPVLLLGLAGQLVESGNGAVARGLVFLVAIPLGLLLIGKATGAWSQAVFLKNLPVVPIAYTAQGVAKVVGTATGAHGLVTTQTGREVCLWFRERTEQYQQRVVTEYDASSKRTRARIVQEWVTIGTAGDAVLARLVDPSGTAEVDLRRAEVHPLEALYFFNGMPTGSLPFTAPIGSTRTTVQLIRPDTPLTVIGQLVGDSVVRDEFRKVFLAIAGDPGRVYGGRVGYGIGFLILFGVVVAGSVYLNYFDPAHQPRPADSLMIATGMGIALGLGLIVVANRLVSLKRRAEGAWSNIDVALFARANLVPNLVETVRGYARFEAETLERAASLRAGATSRKDRIVQEDEVQRAVERVLILHEGVPELASSRRFLDLQEELVRLEEKIADAREAYNQCATDFNECRETFPNSFVSKMAGYEPLPIFLAGANEREAPPVQLPSAPTR